MMLDVLLAVLWAVGGLMGALPDRRFSWILGALAAAGWGILAGKLKLKQLLIARHPGGYALLGATWMAVAGFGLATNLPRDAVLPACAAAVGALFLLERRSALQGHAIVLASFVAAVMGATRDPSARNLPLLVPFLILLILCLALVHQQWVLQRLRRAAHEGYLLAAQVPGYGGTRTGLAPAVAVVAMTTTLAAAVLYLGVPHFRWKAPEDRKGGDGGGSHGMSGMNDRLSLRAMHDLKMDYRVALRMKLIESGHALKPSLPMRLRGAIVDTTDEFEWWSTAQTRIRNDADDGVSDGRVTLKRDLTQEVLQECEIEATPDSTILGLPVISEVEARRISVDDHGVVRLPDMAATGRTSYRVISDFFNVDPSTYEAAPVSPDRMYVNHRVDPAIYKLAKDVTYGATTAWKKAAMIESFLQSNFEYSTEFDPEDATSPVRALLLDHQPGYCVHFAAAMASLLRHLEVPCRIAQGLYGGEWSNSEQLVVFKFADAHAWVEVWLGDQAGWVPFDPTPHVQGDGGQENPEDFAKGPADPVAPDAKQPEKRKPSSSFSTEPLTALSLERQAQWLRSLRSVFADAWASTFGKVVVFFLVFAFSLVFTWRLLPRHERNRLRAVLVGGPGASTGFWEEFLVLSARAGFRPGKGETPLEFSRRVERSYPGAARVAFALYAVHFGGRDAVEKAAEARPVLDGIRKAQAGKAAPPPSPGG